MSRTRTIPHEVMVTYRRKNMSVDQFISFVAKKDPEVRLDRSKLEAMDDGAVLAVHQNADGKRVRIHLKKIFIYPYKLSYRNTKTANGKAREGREILISSFPISKKALKELPV